MAFREIEVKSFTRGLIDSLEARSIPRGAASYNKNWITRGDKIEIRRGYARVGAEVVGNGRISGIGVTNKANGDPRLFSTYARKVQYYDDASALNVELGTNILPVAADNEDVSFSSYASLAGYQMWLCSQHAGPYKIMVANPGDYADQYLSTKNHHGHIGIKQNRMTLWGKTSDKTGVYMSYIDAAAYTTVTNEVIGTGNGTLKTFSNTLTFKGSGARRTCFGISVQDQDGIEVFTDDYNGVLTGSAGGTGTINYMTGAISVTFAAAVVNTKQVRCTYQWEDSTNTGIADFSSSAPRSAGQGVAFRQDDGGQAVQAVVSYEFVEYCLHIAKTWSLTLTIDDTNAENLIFREKVGIPNHRAAIGTGDGIYYIDTSDKTDPQFRILTLSQQSTKVIPQTISHNLNLNAYEFDRSVVFEFGDYIIFECRDKSSTYNNVMFVWNRVLRLWDKLDYIASCFAEYSGSLIAGDDISNNLYELFSGFDDDDSTIDAEWIGNQDNLDTDELKKVKQLIVKGEIVDGQIIEVYAKTDEGNFVFIGDIDGGEDYVDSGVNVYVGASKTGSSTIGGSSPTDVNAHPYTRRFKLELGKFSEITLRFKSVGLGYCSVTGYIYKDIRLRGPKIAPQYRTSSNV